MIDAFFGFTVSRRSLGLVRLVRGFQQPAHERITALPRLGAVVQIQLVQFGLLFSTVIHRNVGFPRGRPPTILALKGRFRVRLARRVREGVSRVPSKSPDHTPPSRFARLAHPVSAFDGLPLGAVVGGADLEMGVGFRPALPRVQSPPAPPFIRFRGYRDSYGFSICTQ